MLLPIDEVIEGVQGGKLEFEIALVDENSRPVDTTVYDLYKICIKRTATTRLEVSQTANANGSIMTRIGSPVTGVFKVLINPADTLLLNVAERQEIDLELKESATPTNTVRVVFHDRLTVVASSCP
jgi:hypothetical protein